MSRKVAIERERVSDLTIQQTMDELGVSRDTVNRLVRRGELEAYDVSTKSGAKRRHLRVRYSSVLEFKDRRTAKNAVSLASILRDL